MCVCELKSNSHEKYIYISEQTLKFKIKKSKQTSEQAKV